MTAPAAAAAPRPRIAMSGALLRLFCCDGSEKPERAGTAISVDAAGAEPSIDATVATAESETDASSAIDGAFDAFALRFVAFSTSFFDGRSASSGSETIFAGCGNAMFLKLPD